MGEQHVGLMSNESFDVVPMENRIVGMIYFVFSWFCIIPYMVCLWAIISDKNLRTKPSYIIVFHIGVVDVSQLVFNGLFGGVFTFFGTTWHPWFNKFIGGIMNIGWVVYTALVHVLAFNRYIFICKSHLKEVFFSRRKTELLMGICWFYGVLWFIAYMCPDLNLIFNVYLRCWDYDENRVSRIAWLVELLQDTFHFVMSIIFYAFSFYSIRKKTESISASQINENKKERKLLIQAVLICLMIGLTLIGFFAVPAAFNGDRWSTTASTLIWLACCGNNCAIYLKFNKVIRQRVYSIMFGCYKHPQGTHTSAVSLVMSHGPAGGVRASVTQRAFRKTGVTTKSEKTEKTMYINESGKYEVSNPRTVNIDCTTGINIVTEIDN